MFSVFWLFTTLNRCFMLNRCLHGKERAISYRTVLSRASGVPWGSRCDFCWFWLISGLTDVSMGKSAQFPIDWYRRRLLGRPVARAMAVFAFYVGMTFRCSPNNLQMYGLMSALVWKFLLSAKSFMWGEVFGMLNKLAVQQLNLACGRFILECSIFILGFGEKILMCSKKLNV